MADLFSGLDISTGGSRTHAARVDAGWAAWRRAAPPAEAGRLARWRFWLTLWQHFGTAQFFVQVDDSYHTATSVRLRHRPEQRDIEVLLIQTDNMWQCLWGLWQRRRGARAPRWRKLLHGQMVRLSRYPLEQIEPMLPPLRPPAGRCNEAVLDLQRPISLPLQVAGPGAR